VKWLDRAETAVFEACRTLPEGTARWTWDSAEGQAARRLLGRGILRIDRATKEMTYLRPTELGLLLHGALRKT
jgi:hypothetical protein